MLELWDDPLKNHLKQIRSTLLETYAPLRLTILRTDDAA
jgi:hypothetical protein